MFRSQYLLSPLVRSKFIIRSGELSVSKVSQRSYHRNRFKFRDNYETRNKVIYGIIGGNVLVYGMWQMSENDGAWRYFMNRNFTISPFGFFQQNLYYTAITSFFSQNDLAHILFNMIAFFTFGQTVIHAVGTVRFLGLYFGGGIVSSLCQVVWPKIVPSSWPARRNSSQYTQSLGASGAINAIVAWYIAVAPRSLIYLYGVLPIPAALFGLAYIGFDAYSLYFGNSGIGNAAHLGGAAFGGAWFILSRGRASSFRKF